MIPMVRERWNLMITGDPGMNYRQFIMLEYFAEGKSLRLLSLGSGSAGHEIELAAYPQFKEIVCIDIAQNRIDEAKRIAAKGNLENIRFICTDFNTYDFPESHFDMVLFNSSLHHFDRVEQLLGGPVKKCLKPTGSLIINEYVGPKRLQFPRHQLKAINKALKLIPQASRKRFMTNLTKRRFYGNGLIRVILADPSESIDSASIVPSIHQHFETVLERPYGGNILMSTLKDISHHFTKPDQEQVQAIKSLFAFEDEYLITHPSDNLFGIYKKPSSGK
jgi:ubiquinone/menaquinone biosynthesis C-methylase UbiE